MYEGKEEVLKYISNMKSMAVRMGRIANQNKVCKWLSFKKYKLESQNI